MAGNLTAMIASIFSGGVTADPYYEYTTLLLPGNGTNGAQNNTFLDGSSNNFTITRNGNTTQGTFSPFSQTGWGNYFDGTGDSLSIANNVALQLTGAFTMEAWYYPLGFPGSGLYDCLLTTGDNSLSNAIAIYINSSGGIQLYNHVTNAAIFNTASGVVLNAWNHIAATRNSSNGVDLWLNGVSQGSTVTVSSSFTSTTPTRIGTSSTNQDCYGYISNVRIVKGVAVYTGAFTPPTSPLAATQSAGTNISAITGTQTSLLTCQSNRFIDNSTNNFTITVNGNTSVVAFSPFNPTASWSAATNGGSGYFDGNGDYLSVANNTGFDFGSSNFTIEAWAYFTSFSSTNGNVVVSKGASGSVGGDFYSLQANPSGVIQFYFGSGTPTLAGATLSANRWYHLAVTRSGNNFTLWVDGASSSTTTSSTTLSSGGPLIVGSQSYSPGASDRSIYGYVSNLRTVKTIAVYTGNFTPPTAPITNAGSTSAASYPSTTNVNTSFASSATSLLLNFTNAGIYDATSKNDLETVGNAQISTAVNNAFGANTGVMAFDGTGDYLIPNISTSDLYTFGTGAFTVEFWLYLNSTSGVQICIDFRPLATNGPQIILFTNSGVLTFQASSTVRITGSTLSTGQWYHIALCRSGTDTKMFLNGTQTGSTYSSDTTSYTVGANRPAIGADGANLSFNNLNGYLQDVRITKGYARYTANFTAPTAAFPTL